MKFSAMKINALTMINSVIMVHKAALEAKDLVAARTSAVSAAASKIFSVLSLAEAQNPNAPRKGDDLQYTMTVTFEEAVFGTEKQISIRKQVKCETCGGSGAKPGSKKNLSLL